MTITELVNAAYATAKQKGWHDEDRNDAECIALMHSELSEALEAMRKPELKDTHLPHLDAVGVELADTIVRIFDYCGMRNIDLETCVMEKMAYNLKRSHKHGGKVF